MKIGQMIMTDIIISLLILIPIYLIPVKTNIETKQPTNQIAVEIDKVNSATDIENEDKIKAWIHKKNPKLYPKLINDIYDATCQYKDQILILAIMEVESTFNPLATSKSNSIGLMQINPIHKDDLIKNKLIKSSIYELYDIETNIRCAVWLFDKFRNQNPNITVEQILTKYLGSNNQSYKAKVLSNMIELSY